MKDPLFGNLDWADGYWEGSVILPYFAGFGADMPRVAQDPTEDPDPFDDEDDDEPAEDADDRKRKKGTVDLLVTPAGGARLKPTDAQRLAWKHVKARGDAAWEELMQKLLETYRRQRPSRVHWWKKVYGDHALPRALPDLKNADALSKTIVLVDVLVQPHAVPPAATPDVLVQFAGGWLPTGFAAVFRDGRVADFVTYDAPDEAEKPIRFEHPAFGRLAWNDHYAAWLGNVRWEGLDTFANVAPMRARFEKNRARFKNPELPLEWDFIEGRLSTVIHPLGVEPPTARQVAAYESFRAAAEKNAAAIAEAIHRHYQGSGAGPKIAGPDAMREHLELATIHVHPDDRKDKHPPAIGVAFYGPADTSFGVRFRDGRVESVGESEDAEPRFAKDRTRRPKQPPVITTTVAAAPASPAPPPSPSEATTKAKSRGNPKAKPKAAPKPAASKPARKALGRVGYRLTYAGDDDVGVDFHLHSAHLDPDMHPAGTLTVNLDRDPEAPGARVPAVPIEQDQTLFFYLRKQKLIRQKLEAALADQQQRFDPDGESVRGDVWAWARLLRLEFEPISPRRKNPPRHAFSLYLDCDWEQEHVVVATFEDEKLKPLDIE